MADQPAGARPGASCCSPCSTKEWRSGLAPNGYVPGMFLLFSNRLGCAGSLALSIVVTLVLLALFAL